MGNLKREVINMDTVTTYWMAGVVSMMVIFGVIAIYGYIKKKPE